MIDLKRYDFNPHDGEQGMEESLDGDFVTYADYLEMKFQRDEANKRWYEEHMKIWKAVVSTEVFQDLKHGQYRDILNLLADGEISVGKCAEAIVERAAGIEPLLPACDLSQYNDDMSWKEQFEALKKRTDSEINGVLELIPNPVRVREGAGNENLFASLAVSVAKLLRKGTA